MAFSIQTADLPAIYSYASAVRCWEGITPLRGYDDDQPRPLGRRASNNPKTVRRDPKTGDIVFKLHWTDCVRYSAAADDAPERITLGLYPSISTVAFIDALTPSVISLASECKHLFLGRYETQRIYQLTGNGCALDYVPSDDGDCYVWRPVFNEYQNRPWQHYRVDRKAANAAYKEHNLDAFMDFYSAYITMMGFTSERWAKGLTWSQRKEHSDKYPPLTQSKFLSILADASDRSAWPHAAFRMACCVLDPVGARKQLMTFIKHHADCFTVTQHAYLTKDNYSSVVNSAKLVEHPGGYI